MFVLVEPMAQALLFFVFSLVASVVVVVLVRSRLSFLGALVRAAMVFVLGLLLWLGWSALDGPAWGGVRIGVTTWPLGVLAVITAGTAFVLELLARRMQLTEARKSAELQDSKPASERQAQVARELSRDLTPSDPL